MWRLWVGLGAAVWIVAIIASGAMNFFFGLDLGRTPNEGMIFASVGVAADAWKAIGPIFLLALWRGRRALVTTMGALIWIACFAYAVSSAIGLAAQNRSTVTSSRDAINTDYQSALSEIAVIAARSKNLSSGRAPHQVEAGISVLLAKPVPKRGTVGTVSKNCADDTPLTRADCASVARLQQELADAREGARLDTLRAKLLGKAESLRANGGAVEADPQARLIARLTFGWLQASDVGLVLILALAAMIELISAFAPVVLSEYAAAARAKTPVAARRDKSRTRAAKPDSARQTLREAKSIGGVYEFMADCVRPFEKGRVTQTDLYATYGAWCTRKAFAVLERRAFLDSFRHICWDDLDGKVTWDGRHYAGLALNGEDVKLPSRPESVALLDQIKAVG